MKSRMEGEREGDKESRVRVQPNPRGSKLFHADVHLGPLSCSFLLEVKISFAVLLKNTIINLFF